ncbi:hypothetical protein RFI_14381 [Reticulomyxa filosa]|uniref:Uncharacterized protein n=1 Tax=Reticulomyxa filosa TaxID=46433 RepID=X6NA83_RETFI|nr:hypothetical protein RFI_14381 [Reticulomyxa filosa]|eukprot:ETO22813.1 hypothetical protein RFI_14381 [Reticulomyxa filosa]
MNFVGRIGGIPDNSLGDLSFYQLYVPIPTNLVTGDPYIIQVKTQKNFFMSSHHKLKYNNNNSRPFTSLTPATIITNALMFWHFELFVAFGAFFFGNFIK